MRRILTILMLAAVSAATAQERFDYIFRRNPWNGGPNAAGIRQDSLSRSYAEIYFTKENGGLTGHSASDDSWNAGAKTESVRHLKKVSFSGGFGYDYFDGRNMCGSMFTEPGYYPVDILEFTPGRKVREDYTFTGGMSAVLGNRWTGGLRVEFEARNYAKRKDLRHKNTRLDFEFSPGVMYHAGRFAVGAVYIVGTNSEKVAAEGVGPGADLYEAFFDRGLLYGSLEKWGDDEQFPKAVYEMVFPGIEKMPIRNAFPYFKSFLSCTDGIVSVDFVLRDMKPVMRIRYVKSMWDDAKLWKEVFQAEKWTLRMADGTFKEADPRLKFTNPGKTVGE